MHVNPAIAAFLEQLNHPALPGIDLSLERMWVLLEALGNPQDRLPPVMHLAGTNGKGSTLAFLRGIYTTSGYRVQSYTSPHLVRFNERIGLNGREISDAQLLPLLERVAMLAEKIPVTFFEATTALALLAFSQHAAEVLLLETGLGGRLDATNVVRHPAATVLAPIAMDHMEFLGDDLAGIAREKAGILKAGTPCIVGKQEPQALEAILQEAQQVGVPVIAYGEGWNYQWDGKEIHVACGNAAWTLPPPPLAGGHQHHNAALASVVARQVLTLPVHPNAVAAGIAAAQWPGRLQLLRHGPLVEAWGARREVRLDGGHNIHAAEALAVWVAQQSEPVTMLCGMMKRKDAVAFFTPLAGKLRDVITVPIPGEECHAPEELAEAARKAGIPLVRAAATIERAVTLLSQSGILLIAGSLFLAGEVLKNHG